MQLSVLLLDVDDDYDDGGDHHDRDHHDHYCFVHQHVQLSVLLLDDNCADNDSDYDHVDEREHDHDLHDYYCNFILFLYALILVIE